MANVHRFNEYNRPPPNQDPESDKNPRDENFCDFLKYSCCPTFTVKSFIMVITVIDILMFIISLAMSEQIKGEFLQPSIFALVDLGAKYAYNMKRGYIWLFVTPVFLHGNFMHIFSNLFAQFIFGMSLETTCGTKKFVALYFICAIGGNLFSALISDSISVGASTAIFGLLGAYLGYLILNWDALARFGPLRCMMLCIILFIVLINILIGTGKHSTIDNYGHLGGFIVGIALSMVLFKPLQNSSHEQKLKRGSIGVLIVYFALGFILFFTVRHPQRLM